MAIAEAFVEREKGNEVLFIGTEKGSKPESYRREISAEDDSAKPIQGKSLLEKVKAIWGLPMAIFEARTILKEFQPQLVLGVGGYAPARPFGCFPSRDERAIQEQNVMPNDESNSKVVQPADLCLLRRGEEILPGKRLFSRATRSGRNSS